MPNILQSASKTLQIEMETLAGLQHIINDNFEQIVRVLHGCEGRIIVTGVGKSALIAQKMVATFNSTGSPAMFLHAADALHGDLGMIQEQDIVLAVSKSGETAELKSMAKLLSRRSSKLIALTSRKQCSLAEAADINLHIPIVREACPYDLAPTSSTTAQLVIGDMLAIALMHLRGFSERDFARNHPGGSLGKKLLMQVKDLLARHRPAVQLNATVQQVISEISSKRLGATAVLDEQGSLCGIITDGDLRRMLQSTVNYRHLLAENIMTPQPKSVSADVLATEVLENMHELKINQMIVLEGTVYIGMVHIHDLLAEGL